MSSIVVPFGAQLNSEIEHQTAQDTTAGPDKPLGVRGATMADTVGKAEMGRRHDRLRFHIIGA
jgi:membrane protein